ncbi:helix-turn-helix domain-containing protein [Kitasatospora sp. NBC_01287]|uniref:ArsR/SmtB family transcription factor n=1 Tax=Kitasatospora sp. NBC_01287 TaxID=2903573 RepID=UPI0022575DFB|nr:winged helix-turn-helix domain-containing protein [Kitasatospora sp. NBC_01287]MCX4749124.1 helix-turn-helix domain-containing protein [Kitasatospora sp. NBC_01287]
MSNEPPPISATSRIVDSRSLRALAHPLRLRILDLLSDHGASTSAKLAERLGENTGTVSWHLRHLAEHGYIEEEEGRGTKRERWWRRKDRNLVLRTRELTTDPETLAAMSVYRHHYLERTFQRAARALAVPPTGDWVGAGNMSDWGDVRMTPDQLRALGNELLEVIRRHTPDPEAPVPAEAQPVLIQFQVLPMLPLPTEESE